MAGTLDAAWTRDPGARSAGRRILGHRAGASRYRVRLAASGSDIRLAQALRFLVFNLELNEGLDAAYATLRDEDRFDAVCDHLLVEDLEEGGVVGTYRLQPGVRAVSGVGFYSEQEFDFGPFRDRAADFVELGRACIHASHRNLVVLGLLWRAICGYADQWGCRYFVGCSSLSTLDAAEGAAAYLELGPRHLVDGGFRTHPRPGFACPLDVVAPRPPAVPKLLRAYLSLGARICGAPAIDREFKTIDFLTLLDRRVLGA